jgi:hypothetical protein
MPRLWMRWIFFLSSYTPLMGIYADLNWLSHRNWSIGILVAAALCCFLLWVYLKVLAGNANTEQKLVRSVQQKEADVLNYIAAYIIPFVTFPFDDWTKGIAVVILLGTLGIVYVNSNLIAVNPVLSLLQFKLYEVMFDGDEETHLVISTRIISKGRPITIAKMRRSDIYLQTPERTYNNGSGYSDEVDRK